MVTMGDAIGPPTDDGGASAATILVVDDDSSVRRMLRSLFEHEGYGVIEACNGLDALKICMAQDRVDLIVSDIDMPVLDGLTLCRWLDGEGSCAPVIVISGMDVNPVDVCGAASSVVGFLQKPFAVFELLEMATTVIS